MKESLLCLWDCILDIWSNDVIPMNVKCLIIFFSICHCSLSPILGDEKEIKINFKLDHLREGRQYYEFFFWCRFVVYSLKLQHWKRSEKKNVSEKSLWMVESFRFYDILSLENIVVVVVILSTYFLKKLTHIQIQNFLFLLV